jgi:hypothetical protein
MARPGKDYTNQRFGRLLVIKKTDRRQHWLCKCDCGNEKEIHICSMTAGKTRSCGCLAKETSKETAKKLVRKTQFEEPLPGEIWGNFTVIERDQNRLYRDDQGDKTKYRQAFYLAKCICGKTISISSNRLRKTRTNDLSCGCKKIKPPGEVGLSVMYCSYRTKARERELDFKLTKPEFKHIVERNCAYCGAPPSQVSTGYTKTKSKPRDPESLKRTEYVHNGIDRVDSNRGYILDNCAPCCKYCNWAKMALPYADFIDMIKRIYNNLNLGAATNANQNLPPII